MWKKLFVYFFFSFIFSVPKKKSLKILPPAISLSLSRNFHSVTFVLAENLRYFAKNTPKTKSELAGKYPEFSARSTLKFTYREKGACLKT